MRQADLPDRAAPSRSDARLRFTTGNRLRLLETGTAYFAALVQRIDGAQREVRLETYIFEDDSAGQVVAGALMRAAQRGVRVRLITDGIGTKRLPLLDRCAAAGVAHRVFNPHLFGRFGFSRTHRKLAVVDDRHGYVGGINIVDDLNHDGHRLDAPRWDFAIETEGAVVAEIATAFDIQWQRIETRYNAAPLFAPRAAFRRPAETLHAPQVAFVARDNFRARRAIEKAYLVAIGRARDEVVLANPYFAPGRRLRRALTGAARRGVRVSLLIGRKEFAALDYAVPFLYATLLNAGVRIAEYDKALLHAKVAVVDGQWATVGSSNLDALSLVLNNEANLVLLGCPEIAGLRRAILKAIGEATPIDAAHYAARPWHSRLLSRIAYTAYRWTMKLITVGQYD
jgi:cardiolipin synthase